MTGEILDSWDYIISSINNNTYATKYTVGNYKPLDLGSEGVVNMQIAAIDGDVMSDGSGNAHITWIAKELLATKHCMNSSGNNANGWAASEMRVYLQNDIWTLIPTNVQNAIVAVDKSYYDYTTLSTLICSDKIWIPSVREMGFKGSQYGTYFYCEDSGIVYSELFTDDNSRIKTLDGTANRWSLRTAYAKGKANFYVVDFGSSAGKLNGAYYSKDVSGVALCFCM